MVATAKRAKKSTEIQKQSISVAQTPRELRASRAADRQGLILRKSRVRRISNNDPGKYGLVYARYNRLVANDLDLDAIEGWLGIQPTTTDQQARTSDD